MCTKKLLVTSLAVAFAMVSLVNSSSAQDPCEPYPYVTEMIKLTGNEVTVGRVDWLDNGCVSKIIYDRQYPTTHYEIWEMDDDGQNHICLTCNLEELEGQAHVGNPDSNEEGDWIVFVSNTVFGLKPGQGFSYDLWVLKRDPVNPENNEATKIKDVGQLSGILHPHWNPYGTRIYWSEFEEQDRWKLYIADFDPYCLPEGKPCLRNEISLNLTDGDGLFKESHSWHTVPTPLEKNWLFCSTLPEAETMYNYCTLEIYNHVFKLEPPIEQTYRLTEDPYNPDPEDPVWGNADEHAHFSPTGDKIIWISSRENPDKGCVWWEEFNRCFFCSDHWIMNKDGSCQSRLTSHNVEGHPHRDFFGAGPPNNPPWVVCADLSWNAAGNQFIGYVRSFIKTIGGGGPTLYEQTIIKYTLDKPY